MRTLLLLLLFYHGSSPVKHSLKYITTATSGLPDFPEFVAAAMIDENLVGYCDNNKLILDPKHDWVKKLLENYPHHLDLYRGACFSGEPTYFKATMNSLKQRFNQSGGVHILQRISGCEWDDETREILGFNQYGYDGEDFLSIDLKTKTWIAPKQQAFITKLKWDADKAKMKFNQNYLTVIFPEWLNRPSVSLLQKTPSSPVSCLATGFYPHRASLVWRKDGEELHEEVDHGEILPNHDGTFQMRVDLKLSSVTPEDWTRYDCVFQLSGVNEDIVTKLDKAVIRTNEGKTGIKSVDEKDNMTAIIAAVVFIALVLIAVIGAVAYKKKKDVAKPDTSSRSSSTESMKTEPLMKEPDTFSSSSDGSSTGSLDSNTPLISKRKTGNSSP